MFGYVNICSSTISEDDKALYSSYYCGLCRAIGKKSQLMRLGLNNDLTFLSVLLSGVVKEEPEFKTDSRCLMHAMKKQSVIKHNFIMDYASDMNILLVYLKACDDIDDDKKLLGICSKPILKTTAKKVINKYPKLSANILENLKRLSSLEKENCANIDEVADCFAKVLEAIFVPDFIDDDGTKKILSWMGYNLGRWIYIADAYDDLDKDRKKNKYNPLIFSKYANDDELKNNIYDSMTYTLANVANAYDLLDIKRNDSLIRNILYAGLLMKQEGIFNKTEEKNGSLQGAGGQPK